MLELGWSHDCVAQEEARPLPSLTRLMLRACPMSLRLFLFSLCARWKENLRQMVVQKRSLTCKQKLF